MRRISADRSGWSRHRYGSSGSGLCALAGISMSLRRITGFFTAGCAEDRSCASGWHLDITAIGFFHRRVRGGAEVSQRKPPKATKGIGRRSRSRAEIGSLKNANQKRQKHRKEKLFPTTAPFIESQCPTLWGVLCETSAPQRPRRSAVTMLEPSQDPSPRTVRRNAPTQAPFCRSRVIPCRAYHSEGFKFCSSYPDESAVIRRIRRIRFLVPLPNPDARQRTPEQA